MKSNDKNKNRIIKELIKEAEKSNKRARQSGEEINFDRKRKKNLTLELKAIESIHAIASSTPPKPKPKPSVENTNNADDVNIK